MPPQIPRRPETTRYYPEQIDNMKLKLDVEESKSNKNKQKLKRAGI